jgi:hypothetical protein
VASQLHSFELVAGRTLLLTAFERACAHAHGLNGLRVCLRRSFASQSSITPSVARARRTAAQAPGASGKLTRRQKDSLRIVKCGCCSCLSGTRNVSGYWVNICSFSSLAMSITLKKNVFSVERNSQLLTAAQEQLSRAKILQARWGRRIVSVMATARR